MDCNDCDANPDTCERCDGTGPQCSECGTPCPSGGVCPCCARAARCDLLNKAGVQMHLRVLQGGTNELVQVIGEVPGAECEVRIHYIERKKA